MAAAWALGLGRGLVFFLRGQFAHAIADDFQGCMHWTPASGTAGVPSCDSCSCCSEQGLLQHGEFGPWLILMHAIWVAGTFGGGCSATVDALLIEGVTGGKQTMAMSPTPKVHHKLAIIQR